MVSRQKLMLALGLCKLVRSTNRGPLVCLPGQDFSAGRRACALLAVMLVSAYSLAADIIATYPPGTILENIAIAPGGDLFVSAIDSGTAYRISPAGSSRVFGQVPGPLLGLALNTDGTLVGAGGTSFYRFASNGTPSLVTNVAGAQDLNGVTLFSPGTFLVADDVAGTIWQVNVNTGSTRAWLTSDLLAPPAGPLPIGANGVKLFHGAVYISNTGAGTILRVPILPDGSAGTPEVYASSIALDDFAFGSDGSIFGATQTGTILRLRPDGTVSSIATGTLGDAAVAFGRTAADLNDIYIVNNGGAFLGLPGGPEAASVVRLATDTTGITPESQAIPEPGPLLLTGAGLTLLFLRFRISLEDPRKLE
jgi:sugar lactone lactonase YvrE